MVAADPNIICHLGFPDSLLLDQPVLGRGDVPGVCPTCQPVCRGDPGSDDRGQYPTDGQSRPQASPADRPGWDDAVWCAIHHHIPPSYSGECRRTLLQGFC